MTKILLDTDPGIDDAQAIAYAIAHPDIELVGLTTVFGNASIDTTTRNALLLLDQFGASEVPVSRGAAVPLVQAPRPHADFVHGQDGLGNLDLPASDRNTSVLPAPEFIMNQASLHRGEVTLVAVGPLTNIANALDLDPALPKKVKELVIMGGTVDEPGNVSPLAEANFLNDPHAADRVLSQDWPVTIIGLDVTHQIMLTDTHLATLRDGAGKTGQLLWDSSRFYVDFYTKSGAAMGLAEPACAMHDATALVYVHERDSFETVSGGARVIESGVAVGQFAINRKHYQYPLDHWDGRPHTHAAMTVDADHVRQAFLDTIIKGHRV